jgi:hypothetical protein
MQAKVWLLALCLAAGAAFGQSDQSAPASSKSSNSDAESSSSPRARAKARAKQKREEIKEENYIRTFSAGATFSPLVMSLIRKDSTSSTTTSGTTTITVEETKYSTSNKSQRAGFGVTGQVMISDRVGIAVAGIMRRMGYTLDYSVSTTTTKGTTIKISTVSTHEDTRARVIDVPVTMRYFTKNRHDPGPRVFFDLGGAVRHVSGAKTIINATDADGNLTCCTTDPVKPTHKITGGVVAGMGVYLIDPVGLRVVPEVRYTRWLSEAYTGDSRRTIRNQVEVLLTFSF